MTLLKLWIENFSKRFDKFFFGINVDDIKSMSNR